MRGRCRIRLFILIIQIICQYAFEKSEFNSPPTFVQPVNLGDPASLILVWGRSNLYQLNCTAENADNIQWKFAKMLNESRGDLPDAKNVQSLGLSQDDKTKRLSFPITNRNTPEYLRPQLNGYYICIASNRHGFTVETPPIRIIVPAIDSSAVSRAMIGVQGQPFKLQCFDEATKFIPEDLLSLNMLVFNWDKRDINSRTRIVNTERIKINSKTGDVYFATLKPEDKTQKAEDCDYLCDVALRGVVDTKVVSLNRLEILAGMDPTPPVDIAYPITTSDKTVVCMDGRDCLLSCVYSGMNMDRSYPPPFEWKKPPGAEDVVAQVEFNTIKFKTIKEAEGQWICGAAGFPSAIITVEVVLYPQILEEEMIDQFVTVGTDVVFECNTIDSPGSTLKFYINGVQVNGDGHAFAKHSSSSKILEIPKVQREHSSSVTCVVTNAAGTRYKAAELNVYKKSNLTLTPPDGIILENSDNTTDRTRLNFTCRAVLDPKVIDANIHWRTNHSELANKKVTLKRNDVGIDISTTRFLNHTINSTLHFSVGYSTKNSLLGFHWWCVVEMKFGNRPEPIDVMSDAVPFSFGADPPSSVADKSGFSDWWLVGLILAICFVVLIIILVVCCVRQQKGEEYRVAEKEKLAGHNVNDSIGQQTFLDYKRPATGGYMPMSTSDQDPMPGSRSSLDRSEKAIDSDSEGMDEYGDIDPGRFNEDGSFIGQYGKVSSNMEV
ncbi:neural cell adhesion molecule L1-like isoform X2 [Watersipora subatra]